MDIIIWLFSTAKQQGVLSFLTKLKKVFATQQKLVEKTFNMISKYNAGIWVKKTTSNVKCCSFRSLKICLEKGFSLCLTPRIQNLTFFLFFAVTFITYFCTNKL